MSLWINQGKATCAIHHCKYYDPETSHLNSDKIPTANNCLLKDVMMPDSYGSDSYYRFLPYDYVQRKYFHADTWEYE